MPALSGSNSILKQILAAFPALGKDASVQAITNKLIAADFAGRMPAYPDGLRKKMRDEFVGAALDPTKFTARAGGGGTYSVTASNLTLSTGDGANGSYAEVVSVDTYQAPCRLVVVLNSISQRIVNQEIEVSLIEAGTAANAVPTDGARVIYNGTVNTTAQTYTHCDGDTDGPNAWTTNATSGTLKLEIDLMTDEVWIYDGSANSTSSRSHYQHADKKCPNPNKAYRVRIAVRNTAAAASATTLSIDSALIEDNAYLPVELAHARGSTISGEALAVLIAGGTATVLPSNIYNDDTNATLLAAATFTGTARDIAGNASGSTHNRGGRFRARSLSDQPGTLFWETSRDNITYRRVKSVPAAQVGGTGLWVAELNEFLVTRWARVVYTNGATNQTIFELSSLYTAEAG